MTQGGSARTVLTVYNLTARRIAIANPGAPNAALLFPPFGERVVSIEQFGEYDFEPWVAQRLVRVEKGLPWRDRAAQKRASVPSFVAGYSFMATLLLLVATAITRRGEVALIAALAAVVTLGAGWRASWKPDAWTSMTRSLNIFVGLVLAFGLPAAAIWYVTVNGHLSLEGSPELPLALVSLSLFLGMASALPAALFMFFTKQKAPMLRGNFLRDVVRLDPNIQTIMDAESTYDAIIEDVFGSRTSGAPPRGRLPVLACTGVISGLWVWALVPGLPNATTLHAVLVPQPDIVTFAFLGAYVFGLNMLFRRYTRADLGPKAYTHIMIRIFLAVSTTWVLSFAPFTRGADGKPVALMLLLAFFIGILPETGTAIVADMLQEWDWLGGAIPSLGEDHPLARLDGMSLYDRAQLLEVGIENVESLAHHKIIDLMLWTRLPTGRLVDFVDQAILYLHLRGPADAADAEGGPDGAHQLLSRHGIRTATDLERAYAMAAARSEEEGDALLAMLDTPSLAVHRLRVMIDAMEDDEWMVYIRNWRDQGSLGPPLLSVDEFVMMASDGATAVASTPPPSAVDAA